MYKTKHKEKCEELKAQTQYNNLKSLLLANCAEAWYDEAMKYWDETKDINGFAVYLKGA